MSDTPPKQLDFTFTLGAKFIEALDEGPPPTFSTRSALSSHLEVGTLFSLLLKFEDRDTEF